MLSEEEKQMKRWMLITVLPGEDEVQRWAWGLSSSHAVLCGEEIWRMNIG